MDLKYLNDGIKLIGSDVENRTPCDCTFELRRSENSNASAHEYILRYWCSKTMDNQPWKLKWTSSPLAAYTGTLYGLINNYDITPTNPNPREIKFTVPIEVKDFNIIFCVEADCGGGIKEHCFDIPFLFNDECCKNANKDFPDKFITFQNEGYKLVATYKNGINFWGYYHYGHLAFIRLSDGKKLKAKKLEISFDIINRSNTNSFPPCEPYAETDYDDCTNCKWISENVYADDGNHNHHKRGDVTLSYKGSRGTTIGNLQQKPEYCY